MRRAPLWLLLAGLIAGAALAPAAGSARGGADQTAFAPACPDLATRFHAQCLNPATIGDSTLSGSSKTVAIGQRLSFSVATPPPCAPGAILKQGDPPCSRITWVVLYGASPANWGVVVRKTLSVDSPAGCNDNDLTCAFTVDYQKGAHPKGVPEGAALRVDAVVEIIRPSCQPGVCARDTVPGSRWLDWPLRFKSSCMVAGGAGARSAAAGGGLEGCANGVDSEMLGRAREVPRLATRAPAGILPKSDIYAPLTVSLHLTAHGSRVTQCAGGSAWKWQVVAKPKGAKVLTKPGSGCSAKMQVDRSGPYRIVAKRRVGGKLRQTVKGTVRVQDLLVIAMGDSNGSGEGVGPFWFNQCNRGSASYQFQAAELLEGQSAKHSSVTFVSASCSGAITNQLINRTYVGIHPGPPLSPQIRQIKQRLAPPAGKQRRKVDAALISTGVNDLGFGPILFYCIKYNALTPAVSSGHAVRPPCEDTPVRTVLDGNGGVQEFVTDPRSKQTLAQAINLLVTQLPARYDQLAKALAASNLVKPSAVYLTQYPSFFYSDAQGSICTGDPLDASTWAFLTTEASKLNDNVLAAAAKHGWKGISVPRQLFFGHGYCSSDSWFVGLAAALTINGNKPGAFHPTARGAHVSAVKVLEQECPLLADRKACAQGFPTP